MMGPPLSGVSGRFNDGKMRSMSQIYEDVWPGLAVCCNRPGLPISLRRHAADAPPQRYSPPTVTHTGADHNTFPSAWMTLMK